MFALPASIGIFSGGGLFPGAVFELDAGVLASYSGTTWDNIVTTPADGEVTSAYDFTTLTSINHNGTPGDDSALEYFSNSSALPHIVIGGNTTFIESLHKNNAIFTWYSFVKVGDVDAPNDDYNSFLATKGGTGNDIGINIKVVNSSDKLGFYQGNGSANTLIGQSSNSLITNTKYFLAISYDESTSSGIIYTHDGTTRTITNITNPFTSPSASAATLDVGIHGTDDGGNPQDGTFNLWRVGMSNEALTSNQLDDVYNQYKFKLGF